MNFPDARQIPFFLSLLYARTSQVKNRLSQGKNSGGEGKVGGFSNLANVDIPTQKRLILNTSHTGVKWRDIKLFKHTVVPFQVGQSSAE